MSGLLQQGGGRDSNTIHPQSLGQKEGEPRRTPDRPTNRAVREDGLYKEAPLARDDGEGPGIYRLTLAGQMVCKYPRS